MKASIGYIIVGARGDLGSIIYNELKAKGNAVFGVDVAASVDTVDNIAVCDFSSPSDVRQYFDEECGSLECEEMVIVLAQGKINNEPALRIEGSQLVTHAVESWDEVVTSNLKSAFVGATEFARMCRKRKRLGLVVAFSSISAGGAPGQIAYSAAKGGIESMIKSLARELGPAGIRAVALAPGYIDTASTQKHLSETRIERITQQTPLRRLGRADEIVSTIEWLAATKFISGTIVEVSGGFTL